MSATSTRAPEDRPRPAPAPRDDTVAGSRAWALLVAAVTLSVAASLLVSVVREDGSAAPAAAPDAAPAAPAEDAAGVTQPEVAPAAEPRTAPVIGRPAADVAAPVGARAPRTVRVDLETVEIEGQLADGTAYTYWTFGGSVPGPMLRVREGDTVELTLANAAASSNIHSIDLHAVNGPGGGARATQVPPGEQRTFTFTALNPGVYVYHCATPHIPTHIANGMYGLIVVEPEGGLSPVDREFYVMQGEIYTAEARGTQGLVRYDADAMIAEEATYVVFNGAVAGLTGDAALQAAVGERVRLFVGNGGPNLTSNFHVIGEVFDVAHVEGGSLVNRDVQTTLVPAGGATWVEFTIDVPGDYLLVDHAITRTIDKGALAVLHAEGPDDPSVFSVPAGQEQAAAADGDAGQDGGTDDGAVPVTMTEFAFALPATVPSGDVTFRIANDGAAPHEFAISHAGGHDEHLAVTDWVDAGGSVDLTVDLAPGTYEVACHIPGHYEAGMRATLTVTG